MPKDFRDAYKALVGVTIEEDYISKISQVKRAGNLYKGIISIENLEEADRNAQKGKARQRGVIKHNRDREGNIAMLHKSLLDKTYRTSKYHNFTLYEGKKRNISSLPYYPDRIVHHAIVSHLAPLFTRSFIAQTYSCIRRRGIHKCLRAVNMALKDKEGTSYCLKLDIRKFYPSIDHVLLKGKLRTKIKDPELLWLLDEIIDSYPKGLPLGNYLSQWFANFFLNGLDHWIKQDKGIGYYFRYCDDIVVLGPDKRALHLLRKEIEQFLSTIGLELSNYQVFPVRSRGIDFVGYKSFHEKILLRKSTKIRFKRMLRRRRNEKSIASYNGWLSHGNCRHLSRKLLATT